MWVFGYGSLTWKVDFPFDSKLNGFIKGFKRRFYQHSVDHRGIPERPGRVVTLLPAGPEDLVWGVAYSIPPDKKEEVIAHLDYREKDGYSQHIVKFHPSNDCEPFDITLYIGTECNIWYAGPADIKTIAKQIVESHGPSGENKEYLYNLCKAMREIAPAQKDDHLFELEREVRNLDKNSNTSLLN